MIRAKAFDMVCTKGKCSSLFQTHRPSLFWKLTLARLGDHINICNKVTLFSTPSLHSNYKPNHLESLCQKIEKQIIGLWYFHGTQQHKENQSYSLNHRCRISQWGIWYKGVLWHQVNPVFSKSTSEDRNIPGGCVSYVMYMYHWYYVPMTQS